MNTYSTSKSSPIPRHVAVLGAAGGLNQGILSGYRAAGIGFTAIVRSRPERIQNIPSGARVEVVSSLANKSALESSFSGADAVLTALGVTPTSDDETALLSRNMARVEQAMLAANVERVVLMNSLLSPLLASFPVC